MLTNAQRGMSFNMRIVNAEKARLEEVFRLGVLRDGVQLTTTDMKFPIFGQVIPRIEIEISGPDFLKKVTVRINQESGFMFNGQTLEAWINDKREEVPCKQFVDPERAPTGMYNFGTMRENGIRSFVFDYHTFCAYSCDYCFKENEWEVLSVQGKGTTNYRANFEACLGYIEGHVDDFRNKYDIVWLCTGSITNEALELKRHCDIARALRQAGYKEGIYVSQVVPPGIKEDRTKRIEYLQALKEAGISRFNSGVEIVNTEYRRRFIHGFKGTYTFDDYVKIFADAISVFDHFGVGSCLLAGIEPSRETLHGLETIAELGVVPSPTVLTPFVVKQKSIPFMYDLDELIDVHLDFYRMIHKYNLPVFSGVFSLA